MAAITDEAGSALLDESGAGVTDEAAGAGTGSASLSGTGTLNIAVTQEPGVALSGSGTITAAGKAGVAQLAGTGTLSAVAVSGITATESGAGAISALPGVTSPHILTFPGPPPNSLGAKIELLLAGVWTDITSYVRLRNPMQITNLGRADWTSAIQAGQLTLTLDNRSGNFSPKNTTGAFYPNITRNAQLRLSVNTHSATGVAYSGYRFWGEVSEWPPHWDVSGRDVYCDIVVSGIWRRLSQLQTTLGSAYRRYILNLASGPQSYHPMEDGTGSTRLIPYIPLGGTNYGTFTVLGTNSPSLASVSDFSGSDAVVALNATKITLPVAAGGTATNNVTRFLLSVPAAGDSAAGTSSWNVAEIDSSGTVAKFEVYLNPAGTLAFNLRNSAGTIIASGTTTTNVKGQPCLVSCELTPSGGNAAFALRVIKPGASGITESLTGTLTTASIGTISQVVFGRANVLNDTGVGHTAVYYSAPQSMVAEAYALNGYAGEYALDRFARLCSEMGITYEVIGGASSTTAAMGPQVDDTLANLLQTIEDTDCGLLYEARAELGLGYRTNASMANQAAAVVLAYSSGGTGMIDPALAPVYDDALTRNNVTLSNWTGYTQQAILTAGSMSIANPPGGIGNGYTLQRSVTAAADSQLAGIATFLLNVGTVDEIRFPVITLKMARASLAPFFASVPGLRIGDYLQITGMPSFLTSTPVKQLIWGRSETISAATGEWTIAFNTVPESPWETGFSPGTVQTAQIPGGSAVTSSAPGTSLASTIANGSITPAMLNQGITIHTLGGNAVTIAVSAPATPNMNDIWINSSTGLISQWNGSTWAPTTFNATDTIQAGTIISSLIAANTIVASNIAAGTITAALLAAGIVVAGIVNSTTITGATIIADGSSGEVLVYSGSPATGNLIGSWSGSAGMDGQSNSYPAGLMAQALTLPDQPTDPAATSGASTFFSSIAGRPVYLSQVGVRAVIERSTVNVAQFSVGNTTTPTAISAPLSYLAPEGNQSSEFEIEISGDGTWGTSFLNAIFWQLYVDGSATGTEIPLGITGQTLGHVLGYKITFYMDILTTGSSGTTLVGSHGAVWDQTRGSTNEIPTNSVAIGSLFGGNAFDTTSNHTLQIYAWWNATAGGQQLTTYRTKLTRRM